MPLPCRQRARSCVAPWERALLLLILAQRPVEVRSSCRWSGLKATYHVARGNLLRAHRHEPSLRLSRAGAAGLKWEVTPGSQLNSRAKVRVASGMGVTNPIRSCRVSVHLGL